METTTVYAIRHHVHGKQGMPKNALTNDAREESIEVGRGLAELGIAFDVAASSPQGRALETLLCNMQGMGKMLPIRTDDRLGDAVLGRSAFTGEEVAALKAKAKETGGDVEAMLLTEPDLAEKIVDRGNEGADAVTELVAANPGKTIAFCSHGGSRLEATIARLQGVVPAQAPFMMERGSVARLTFEGTRLVQAEYLGLPKPAAAKREWKGGGF